MPLLCNIFNHFFKIVACSLKNLLIHPTSQFITRFIKANSLSQTMESTDSSTGSQQPNLPPGFRFHPTDEELVVHYLKRKASSAPLPVAIIAEVDLYKFDPWELPAKATFGDQEWYFFSPRDRKYPNGARPNRAATSGYWKATGTDKPVLTDRTQKVGVKKALVFYRGKPPKGIKTNWIMHEYRLADNKVSNKPPGCDLGNKKNSLRLDDWVLCRIYKKHNTHRPMDHDKDDSMEDMLESIPSSISVGSSQQHGGLPLGPRINFGALLENEQNLFEGMLNSAASDHHHHHHHHHHGIRSSTNSFSHLVSSSSNKSEQQLPMLPLKRTLPSLYWTDDGADGGAGPSSSSKRFEGDEQHQDHNGNSSMATLFSQLPQTPPLHQQSILGSLGDGIFRPHNYQLPGMNWYT